MPKLVCVSVKYYSQGDEAAFFGWLNTISCIEKISGVGKHLELELKIPPDDAELRELIAVFHRYKISMEQLRQFRTKENESWFYENSAAYWHKQVFG